MKRLLVAVALITTMFPTTVAAQSAGCQYILGFQALHALDPADTGDCVNNQAFQPNGDATQTTTKGLMAWRKADNWTAFTNGYMTWINGPNGLQSRLNTDRFPWEAPAPAASSAAPAAPAPAVTPPAPAASDGHTYYASTYGTAHSIYCDTDPEWKGLSKTYLANYPSLDAAIAALGSGYTLHKPC